MNTTDLKKKGQKVDLQSDQTSKQFGISIRSTTPRKVFKTLATRTNERTVVLALNSDDDRDFLSNLVRNGENGSFCGANCFLRSTDSDIGLIITDFFNIDLSIGCVLDFVDGYSAFTEDTSNRPSRYREFETVVVVLLKFNSLEKRKLWSCR